MYQAEHHHFRKVSLAGSAHHHQQSSTAATAAATKARQFSRASTSAGGGSLATAANVTNASTNSNTNVSTNATDKDNTNGNGSSAGKRLSRGKSFDLAKWRRRSVRFVRAVVGDMAERKDSDAEELEHWPKRHAPPTLETLQRTSTFSKQEIQTLYRGFKQECPSGVVDEPTFLRIFQAFFPYGEASAYAHYVFQVLDRHPCTGLVSFEQFLHGLERMTRGTVAQRLDWVFDLYDIEQRGYLTRYDVWRITHAVYDLVGRPPPQLLLLSAEEDELLSAEAAAGAPTSHSWPPPPSAAAVRKSSTTAAAKTSRHNSIIERASAAGIAGSCYRYGAASEDHVDRVFDRLDLNQDGLVTRQEFLGACLQDETLRESIKMLDTLI